MNHLEILLELYPDKPWDWHVLSQNPNITWAIIIDFIVILYLL